MADLPWTRWLRSLFPPHSNKTVKKKRRKTVRPRLETLEDRTLLAVLPPAVVTGQRSLGSGFSPQLALDPVNASKLVEVDNTTSAVVGRFSTNGGSTWSTFALPANMPDPNGGTFAQVSNPSVAFDRTEAF